MPVGRDTGMISQRDSGGDGTSSQPLEYYKTSDEKRYAGNQLAETVGPVKRLDVSVPLYETQEA